MTRSLVFAFLIVALVADRATAQSDLSRRRVGLRERPEFARNRQDLRLRESRYLNTDRSPFARSIAAPRVDAFGTPRHRGLSTRLDAIRFELLGRGVDDPLIESDDFISSPIAQTLMRRNRLRPKSIFGDRLARLTGLVGLGIDSKSNGQGALAAQSIRFDPSPPWDGKSYNEVLAAKLLSEAESHYRQSIEHFKESDYLRARHYLRLSRQLDPKKTKAYCAEVLVALHVQEMNTAMTLLVRALDPSISAGLNDLRLDWQEFYPDEQDFKRVVRRLNITANSPQAGPPVKVLLAYLSWLNGDLATARAAADVARSRLESKNQNADNAGEDFADVLVRAAVRLHELLNTSSDQPPKSMAP